MLPSSSGLGHCPLKAKIAGSNPAGSAGKKATLLGCLFSWVFLWIRTPAKGRPVRRPRPAPLRAKCEEWWPRKCPKARAEGRPAGSAKKSRRGLSPAAFLLFCSVVRTVARRATGFTSMLSVGRALGGRCDYIDGSLECSPTC